MEENGLKTVNDEGALRDTIAKVIEENPQSVEDYRNGKEKAIGFLVGQTMKAMKGKANPGMVNKILKELLLRSVINNRECMQAFPYMYKKSCSMKVSEIPVMLQDFYVFTVVCQ